MAKLRVGILGATGMVGQRFVTLLANHPWFEVTQLAASPRSAGKTYADAVAGRWSMTDPVPVAFAAMIVQDVREDMRSITANVDLVFSALDLDKVAIQQIEEDYATAGVAVISSNSAHRWTEDVPVIMPEVNPHHSVLIDTQRAERGWTTGLLVAKPNCSIQSYVPILTALEKFRPDGISVVSLQAISGAGKTFDTWPEMIDNVVPFIKGEEEKSEREPFKIWGKIQAGMITLADGPTISATCIRVPLSDGHMASVNVRFKKDTTKEQLIEAVRNYDNPIAKLGLPSAPQQYITYMEEPDRPQAKLDRNIEHGMGIAIGRLRQNIRRDWQFVTLAHNTIRGAAGGAILTAELLVAQGYIAQPGAVAKTGRSQPTKKTVA
jgi:aspartate-semialdehyde dehydrogenase